jgi:retinol dehydrogenase-12
VSVNHFEKVFTANAATRATLTVNVLSTLLLARLLLPKLSESAAQTDKIPRLTVVSSNLHKFATLEARKAPRILESMKQCPVDFDMRYQDTKLLLHLFGQKLSAHIASDKSPSVCFTIVNPGFCVSELKAPQTFFARMVERFLARSTDEGARTLVDAVAADKVQGRHGMYIDDMQVKRLVPTACHRVASFAILNMPPVDYGVLTLSHSPAAWLSTTDGRDTAERAWKEIQIVLDDAVAGHTELHSQA